MTQPRDERRNYMAGVLDELRVIGARQEAMAAKQEALALSITELKSSMMSRAEIESALDRRMSIERGAAIEREITDLKNRPSDARAQLGTYISIGALAVSALALLAQHWH